MISLNASIQQGQSLLRRLALHPTAHIALRAGSYFLAGFCLSAGSLLQYPLPLAMGFLCACQGWGAVCTALGGALGYWLFWGAAGRLPLLWLGSGLILSLLLRDRKLLRSAPLLLPAVTALVVAAWGVLIQTVYSEGAPLAVYLLQILLALASTWLFTLVLQRRHPILDWLAWGLGVLSLAQIAPIPWLGLGYVAGGLLCSAAPFPAAALAGLALDLAQVTRLPMTAILALGYLVRFLPQYPKLLSRLAPGAVCVLMMYICSVWDFYPLPGLLLGGLAGSLLPGSAGNSHRRGETGIAQVRLEMAAGVLQQTRILLLESAAPPVDEDALVTRAAERACGGCPYRKACRDSRRMGQLPGALLHKPLLTAEELPIVCRKNGRYLAELHRSQEQLRSIRADRERQREYRAAVVQQYQFLSEFLQDLSDQLARRGTGESPCYDPQVGIYGSRPEGENGDRCLRFAGTGTRYYVVLCDGMGTGLGAVQEGRTAGSLLRRLLTAGYPAQYALRSINSLCALRDRAGAVTVDLVEMELDSGKVVLYKWGAAPSYLVSRAGVEKVGTATPPPGLSVTDIQESAHRLTLRREQMLLLVSDGVPEEEAFRCCSEGSHQTPGELATALLSFSHLESQDDATVVTIRLTPRQDP